jgi:hypothetical protein
MTTGMQYLKHFLMAGVATGAVAAGTIAPVTYAAAAPPSRLANVYLAIATPARNVLVHVQAKTSRWNNQTTGMQAAKDVAPAVVALEQFDNKLLRIQWPSSTAADVKQLVRAYGACIGDLTGLTGVDMHDMLSVGNWGNQFARDTGNVEAAVSIVRADLGLPPARS